MPILQQPLTLIAVLLLLLVPGFYQWRDSSSPVALPFSALTVFIWGTAALLIVFPFKGHIFQSKHLGFLVPLLWCWLGLSLSLRRRWLMVLLALLMIANVFSLYRYYHQEKQDWRRASAYVFEKMRPGDVVCFNPFYLQTPFVHYYLRHAQGRLKRFVLGYSYNGSDRSILGRQFHGYWYLQRQDLRRTHFRDMWLIELDGCPVAPPHPLLRRWCRDAYQRSRRRIFSGFLGDIVIYHFSNWRRAKEPE